MSDKKRVYGTLDAAGEYTEWISPTYRNNRQFLDLGIVTSSGFSGTITLQKTNNVDDVVKNVQDFTDDTQKLVEDHSEGVVYRLYATLVSSGEADVELYR